MRTVSEIAMDVADAGRDLQAHRELRAALVLQLADVDARIESARQRCVALRTELAAALEAAVRPAA